MIWLNMTPAAKVFRKNVRSFSGHLKSTNASQKQLESHRILCSFQIWTQKFCVCFLSRIVKKSLKDLKKYFGREMFSYIFTIGIQN
jgi:hypothetical protein